MYNKLIFSKGIKIFQRGKYNLKKKDVLAEYIHGKKKKMNHNSYFIPSSPFTFNLSQHHGLFQ